jgi:hypothetical protein
VFLGTLLRKSFCFKGRMEVVSFGQKHEEHFKLMWMEERENYIRRNLSVCRISRVAI